VSERPAPLRQRRAPARGQHHGDLTREKLPQSTEPSQVPTLCIIHRLISEIWGAGLFDDFFENDPIPKPQTRWERALKYAPLASSLLSLAAVICALFAAVQSYRSATAAQEQFAFATSAVLYGECAPSNVDLLAEFPTPSAVLVASSDLQQKGLYAWLFYGEAPKKWDPKALPSFTVSRCDLKNVGRGLAFDIQLRFQVAFPEGATFQVTSGTPWREAFDLPVPVLPAGESFTFVVVNGGKRDAYVRPTSVITYRRVPPGQLVTDPLAHNEAWSLIPTYNISRPAQ
jgi:hypothetical protein